MKIFGSWTEMVAAVFRKDNQQITIEPNQTTTYTADRIVQLPPEDAAGVLVSADSTQTLTNKSIDGGSNIITNINLTSQVTAVLPIANGGTNSSTALSNNRVMQSSSGKIIEAAAITASRALASDANGIPVASAATAAALAFVDLTSSAQTQINSKQAAVITTRGDLVVGNASNVASRLGIGGNNTVLASNGTDPSWVSVPGGESVGTKTNIDYTILDNDGFTTVLFSTGNTNRAATLPAAANNTNRRLRIKKIDSGTGHVTVTGTIDGATNYIFYAQNEEITVQSDGTNWYSLGRLAVANSYTSVRDSTANYGSTNTQVKRFGTTDSNSGNAWTADADNTTLGGNWTILIPGIYSMTYTMSKATGSASVSITKNSAVTGVSAINSTSNLAQGNPITGGRTTLSWTGPLAINDVIRCMADITTGSDFTVFTLQHVTRS